MIQRLYSMVDTFARYSRHPVNEHVKPRTLRIADAWCLYVIILAGGLSYGWNTGMAAGFGSFLLSTVIMGSAYAILAVSTAEIQSGLPFAGGAYGFARVTLGFFPGYLVGCCEIIMYALHVAASVLTLTSIIVTAAQCSQSICPLIYLAIYIAVTAVQLLPSRIYWSAVYTLTVTSVACLLLYILGSFSFAQVSNFSEVTEPSSSSSHSPSSFYASYYFVGGVPMFMTVFKQAGWIFMGIESIPSVNDVMYDPKLSAPKTTVAIFVTLVILAIPVVILASSLPMNEESLVSTLTPLSRGYALMFGISDSAAGVVFTAPLIFASIVGYMQPYYRVVESMSQSNLLPLACQLTVGPSRTPVWTAISSGFVGFLICIVVNTNAASAASQCEQLYNLCLMTSFIVNISQCMGFIAFRTKFRSIPREFRSLVGIKGVLFAICVFAIGMISIIGFQSLYALPVIIFVVIMIVFSMYYHLIISKLQTFSSEEGKVLFNAHVITFNLRALKISSGGGGAGSMLSSTSYLKWSRGLMLSPSSKHQQYYNSSNKNGSRSFTKAINFSVKYLTRRTRGVAAAGAAQVSPMADYAPMPTMINNADSANVTLRRGNRLVYVTGRDRIDQPLPQQQQPQQQEQQQPQQSPPHALLRYAGRGLTACEQLEANDDDV